MKKSIQGLLLATTLGVSFLATAPATAKADTYWSNHWGWYDNTYSPYYQRRYYTTPGYTAPPNAYYGNRPGYYAPNYYNNAPNYYNRPYYGGGGGVQLGPLQFGWW